MLVRSEQNNFGFNDEIKEKLRAVCIAIQELRDLHSKYIVHGNINSINVTRHEGQATDISVSLQGQALKKKVKKEETPLQASYMGELIPFNFESDELKSFHPVEMLGNKTGTGTDIYLLGKAIEAHLGKQTLPPLVRKFISRMCHEYYHSRPSIEEVNFFFTCLYNFHMDVTNRSLYQARIALLANGLFYEFGTQKDKYTDHGAIIKAIKALPKETTQTITYLSRQNLLLPGIGRLLQCNPEINGVIKFFAQHNLLDRRFVSSLIKEPGLVNDFASLPTHESEAATVKTLLSMHTPNLDSDQLITLVELSKSQNVAVDLGFLSNLNPLWSIEEKRGFAFRCMQLLLSNAKTETEVEDIRTKLFNEAAKKKINYLFAPQSFIQTRFNCPMWRGHLVSNTWMNLMGMVQNRLYQLKPNVDPAYRSRVQGNVEKPKSTVVQPNNTTQACTINARRRYF